MKMIENMTMNRNMNMKIKLKSKLKSKFKQCCRRSFAVTALLCSVAALARVSSSITLFDREEEWKRIEIAVGPSEYSGAAHVGYATDRNTIRIAEISRQMNAEGKLTPPRRGKRVPQDKFLSWCALKPFMGPYKQEKRPFEIQVGVNPFAQSTQSAQQPGGVKLENKPELVDLTPKLILEPDSMAREYRLKVGEVEAEIKRQLDQQLAEAAASGVVMITLAGLDDLACDLAQGKAWISIAAKMTFESAKLSRKPIVTADEFGRIFAQVKEAQASDDGGAGLTGASSQGAWLSQIVLAGANLGIAVEDQMRVRLGQFGATHLLNLYKQMFIVQKGVVKAIDPADYSKLARNLDQVHVTSEVDSPVITQVMRIVPGADQ